MQADYRRKWELVGGSAPLHWSYSSLEELLDNPKAIAVGVMYPGCNTENGIPLIKVANVKNGRVVAKPDFLISQEKDYEYRRTRIKGEELFITLVGNPGDCFLATQEMVGWNVARAIAALRFKDPELREWVRYICLSHPAQHFFDSRLNTTVQKTLNLKDIKELVLPIPPKDERKIITQFINAIEQKIELNRQMNATLEAIAQALFKSWFVDFDPVIDNALAAGNPIPQTFQARAEARKALGDQRKPLPDVIQKQFCDRFVFNDDLGWIPEGWEVTKFDHLAEVIMGQSPKGDTYNAEGEGMPLVNGPVEFGEYFTVKTKWTIAPTKRAAKNDLIVCVRGSTTGRYVKSDDEYCLGRGVCAIRGRISQVFVDQTFKSKINTLLKMTTGSTFPNWNGPTLKSFFVLMPSSNVLNLFDKQAEVAIQNIGMNVVENKTLSNLRDTLLPKLLSGQLRIPEAEKRVAEVL